MNAPLTISTVKAGKTMRRAPFTPKNNQQKNEAIANGHVYPSLRHLREISRAIGFHVAQTAREEGVASPTEDEAPQIELDKFS